MAGCAFRKRLRHDQDRGHAGLGEQDLPAVLDHLDVIRRRFGGAGDLPGLELQHGRRVGVGRLDGDVSPAGGRGGQAVLLKPVAHGHVLGIPQGRGVDELALQPGRAGDTRFDDDRRAAGGRPGNDLDRGAAGLLEGVDRGVRAHVGGVELPGEDGRGLLRPAVVDGGGQLAAAAEILREKALLNSDEGRRVRDIGQQPEPYGHGGTGRAGAAGASGSGAGRSASRQEKRPRHDRADTGAEKRSPH